MDSYQRCFDKAIQRSYSLLIRDGSVADYDEIHAVKSILYAAIERAGMSAERMMAAQGKLRELLTLVTILGNPSPDERREAFRIVEELKKGSYPV